MKDAQNKPAFEAEEIDPKKFIMRQPYRLRVRADITADWNAENIPIFPANAMEYKVEFDAGPWFKTASKELIWSLTQCDWHGDDPADRMACDLANKPELANFFEEVKGGFEVHVNRTDALEYLRAYRPEVYELLRSKGKANE